MPRDKLTPRQRQQWTFQKKTQFCEALAMGVTVATAAQSVGMSRSGAYRQRESDPAFAEAWLAAYEASTEVLEAEAFQRAIGRDEVKIDKDGNAHMVKKYSDLLLIFLLKARKPRVYRDQVDVTVTERRIIVDLLQVVKDPETGKLVLVDGDVPLLSAGERGDG